MRANLFRLLPLGLGLLAAVPAGRAPAAGAAASKQLAAPAAEATMSFEEYEPRSTLVVPEHLLTRARYPFVDVHNHQESPRMSATQVDELVTAMDRLHMAVMVNLSGGSGEVFRQGWANLGGRYPKRFLQFANVDFDRISEPGFGERAARQLAADVSHGAAGLKVFKNLGMFVKDAAGRRVPTDDPRIDPVWEKCAQLGIPVLIHTGEPVAFWQPFDRFNERWLELKQFPGRRRDAAELASFEQTIGELHNVIRRHPRTTFINAHLGWLGNDLGRLGRLLDEMPNMVTEIGAVLHELGRQPRAARNFLIRYQDRVLFGKDIWAPEEYFAYFRTLETADEYFPYYRRRHAFWRLYGLELPDEVLRKIYYQNALRIVPGIDRTLFPQ
jgi:predicted TIM-barrel fold metal-dependent hydrolase